MWYATDKGLGPLVVGPCLYALVRSDCGGPLLSLSHAIGSKSREQQVPFYESRRHTHKQNLPCHVALLLAWCFSREAFMHTAVPVNIPVSCVFMIRARPRGSREISSDSPYLTTECVLNGNLAMTSVGGGTSHCVASRRYLYNAQKLQSIVFKMSLRRFQLMRRLNG